MHNPSLSIRELAERAKRLGAHDLAQGIIDTSPPPALLDSLRALPLERYSTYNNKRGVLEYREALREYLAGRNFSVPVDHIMNTAGTMAGLTSALLAELRPGDTVLLPTPFFINHKIFLETLGFKIKWFPTPLDGPPDWEALAQAMQGVRAVIVTTPTNPTGQVARPETLRILSQAAASAKCLLLIDEMYREFIWEHTPADDAGYDMIDWSSTVLLRSFSKTFAIPGWRIGFAVTSAERLERMAGSHDALYIGGSTLAQHAIANTLRDNLPDITAYLAQLRVTLAENHALLEKAFRSYGMKPLPVKATYFMLIEHGRENDMAALEALMGKKVVVTPVQILTSTPDTSTGFIRIHFAVSSATAREVIHILRS